MKCFYKLIFLIFATAICYSTEAQEKDSTYKDVVSGIVFDSAHNYVLQSATIAIYRVKDTSLVSYQLSDNLGEFHFVNLPTDVLLEIVISYTGYKRVSKEFMITGDNTKIDMKYLNLERRSNRLKEMVVTARIPPVQMKGDTLEFNADAFKMDKNAVVKDLLRKLPGVTVWGDGTITVNGREVNSVLVDGKPFFGLDAKIATQNLPKNAVDKIQVYQYQKDERNPLDSLTEVNIKLKKNKKHGLFGKVGAGYGTEKRFQTEGILSIFSPRTQVSIAGAGNNINKNATDMDMLMRSASYKGIGANIEYQPNFREKGLSQINTGGFTFLHDFINDPDRQKNNRLTADYFINNANNKVLKDTKTITFFKGDSSNVRKDKSQNNSYGTSQNFNAKYDWLKGNKEFYISPSFNIDNSHNRFKQKSSSLSSIKGLQSLNNAFNQNDNNYKDVTIQAGYKTSKDYINNNRLPKNFQVDYTFYSSHKNNARINKTHFGSILVPGQNTNFDRRYNNNSGAINHKIFFSIGDLKNWIFGYNKLANISIQLQNNLYINTRRKDDVVKDWDMLAHGYATNAYLTVNSQYNVFDEMPALTFSKSFYKGLLNRYRKNVSINFTAQGQFYNQRNSSVHSFQNFTRRYQRFIPYLSVNYFNDQYGEYQASYTLSYSKTSNYPTAEQLVPLIDSSNVYYIQIGNINLKPSDRQEISFNLSHHSYKAKNTFFYHINIKGGIIKNNIVDSSITDNLGRSIYYKVNANRYKYTSAFGELDKAFKFKGNQIQISLNTSLNITKNPNYVNGFFNLSNSINGSGNVYVYYTLKDLLAVNFIQTFLFYQSKQTNLSNHLFKSIYKSTSLIASINCTKKLTLSSGITYNCTSSSGSKAVDFTIWNANVSYRFFKANNAELKFSALDLLHQNTNIINYGHNNILTRGTVNVLHQYFMLTFSYFPRKFGKDKKR